SPPGFPASAAFLIESPITRTCRKNHSDLVVLTTGVYSPTLRRSPGQEVGMGFRQLRASIPTSEWRVVQEQSGTTVERYVNTWRQSILYRSGLRHSRQLPDRQPTGSWEHATVRRGSTP